MDRIYKYIYLLIPDDTHFRDIVSGTSTAIFLKLFGFGFSFGFNVLIARILGAEGAGIYFLALMVTTIATVLGRIGLDNTLLRYTAGGAIIGDWESVKGVYQKGMTFAISTSAFITIVVFLLAPVLANYVFKQPELTEPIRWMSVSIIPISLLNLYAEMLRGLKQISFYLLVQGIGVPGFSLVGLYILGETWGVKGAVWAYIIAAALTALVALNFWHRTTPQLRNISGYFETKKLLGTCIPLFVVALMGLLMSWMAVLLLGIWGSDSDVGIFYIAQRTSFLIVFILGAVNSIAAPKFAALYKQGDIKSLESTARYSTRIMILLMSPIFLLLVFAPRWVLSLFGSEFEEGATALVVLSMGQFINVATGPVGYLLIMSGYEKLMRNINIIFAIINIILSILLIPRFGILGAALATALTIASMNITLAVEIHRKLSINILPIPNRWLHN